MLIMIEDFKSFSYDYECSGRNKIKMELTSVIIQRFIKKFFPDLLLSVGDVNYDCTDLLVLLERNEKKYLEVMRQLNYEWVNYFLSFTKDVNEDGLKFEKLLTIQDFQISILEYVKLRYCLNQIGYLFIPGSCYHISNQHYFIKFKDNHDLLATCVFISGGLNSYNKFWFSY